MARPLLFRLEPEQAHELAAALLRAFGSVGLMRTGAGLLWSRGRGQHPVEIRGLTFPNQVGVAAGFDKNATLWPALFALGFGHVEVGTVTLKAQPGNPRPRLFRFPEQGALINRMGFNNDGAEAVGKRLEDQLSRYRPAGPLGINIGKSQLTPPEAASEEYAATFERLADYAGYVVINVSSPNTPGLRALQEGDQLRRILERVKDSQVRSGESVPLMLKLDPDLSRQRLDQVVQTVVQVGFDGVVATNTTIRREGPMKQVEAGGLSGQPLRSIATDVIAHVHQTTGGRLPIIGVGGVSDVNSAREKLEAGAALLQVYTGLIYRGPFLGREIAQGVGVT